MIYIITDEHTPSQLLCCDELSETVRRFFEDAAQSWKKDDLTKVAQRAEAARDYCDGTPMRAERAMALIFLSDVCREKGQLEQAMEHATEARDKLRHQPPGSRLHNEAVATYNLALIHHLQGHGTTALRHYEEARELFDRARNFWADRGNNDRAKRCEQMTRWVMTLRDYLVELEDAEIASTFIVPGEMELPIAERATLARCAIIKESLCDVQAWPDGDAAALSKGIYRVVEVPQDISNMSIHKGDYALVRRLDHYLSAIWWYQPSASDTPEFGDFERGPRASHFQFKPTLPRIIGGKDVKPSLDFFLCTVAIFKRR